MKVLVFFLAALFALVSAKPITMTQSQRIYHDAGCGKLPLNRNATQNKTIALDRDPAVYGNKRRSSSPVKLPVFRAKTRRVAWKHPKELVEVPRGNTTSTTAPGGEASEVHVWYDELPSGDERSKRNTEDAGLYEIANALRKENKGTEKTAAGRPGQP
ncbi:hypothetical protein Cob_v009896 [Colletotrichum orbiculare MAFF 240422]|uniref:Uncharacterized protein n=1 Tax=Colletotrichum orbiculare (strain 104-T / ATCC 96160 / CBS 514.97 / LARS 414 / MAFF 240422) TaxID=1213857 RepID=N4W359_COLOR|nr:hypothetical protein Cob_v009896 [Colletotrichum orbiculare MAFF 240422]